MSITTRGFQETGYAYNIFTLSFVDRDMNLKFLAYVNRRPLNWMGWFLLGVVYLGLVQYTIQSAALMNRKGSIWWCVQTWACLTVIGLWGACGLLEFLPLTATQMVRWLWPSTTVDGAASTVAAVRVAVVRAVVLLQPLSSSLSCLLRSLKSCPPDASMYEIVYCSNNPEIATDGFVSLILLAAIAQWTFPTPWNISLSAWIANLFFTVYTIYLRRLMQSVVPIFDTFAQITYVVSYLFTYILAYNQQLILVTNFVAEEQAVLHKVASDSEASSRNYLEKLDQITDLRSFRRVTPLDDDVSAISTISSQSRLRRRKAASASSRVTMRALVHERSLNEGDDDDLPSYADDVNVPLHPTR